MTWVKICGITNLEDALTAVEAGADALGFVFYEKSPRNVATETVADIVRRMPVEIEKVGVFVGNLPKNLLDLVHGLGLTASQVHVRQNPGAAHEQTAYAMSCFPRGFKNYVSAPANWFIDSETQARSYVSSVARSTKSDRSNPEADALRNFFETIVLDSGDLEQPGGTGVVFDWQKAAPIVEYMKQVMKVVVAGGLNPNNVTEAIRILKPWGVDVSSGVEAKPGKKDPEKVRAFIAAVRQADKTA
jgi:phosphoribosylanthranilate isomerase